MKNPENKKLIIVSNIEAGLNNEFNIIYANMISSLAIAESNLVRVGKESAMPHFIACVKELERIFKFRFETYEDENVNDLKNN